MTMTDFQSLRSELRKLPREDVLRLAVTNNHGVCILGGPCKLFFTFRGYGWCASELLGEGCMKKDREVVNEKAI
jgi:hypothetical protein